MGGGASLSAIPEILTEEQFKTIAGNLYSKDVYDQLKNSDGKITRANLLQELKLEYDPSVDLKIIPWEQLMFDTGAEIGRGSFPSYSLILLLHGFIVPLFADQQEVSEMYIKRFGYREPTALPVVKQSLSKS